MTRQTLAALLAASVMLTLPAAATAQNAGPVMQPGFKPARTSWGHPDISGAWTNGSLTRLERTDQFQGLVATPQEVAAIEGAEAAHVERQNQPTDVNKTVNDLSGDCRNNTGPACGYNAGWTDPGSTVMRVNGQPRSSYITSTPDGRVPPRKQGAEPSRAGRGFGIPAGMGQNDNPETRSLGERCVMSFGFSSGPVMQPQLYNNNYRFVQTKDSVAIWVEMVHDVRVIRLNSKHRTDGVRPWMGDSVGRWDGNTLVVETINFHPLQNFRGAGPKLKVTERFTRVGPDRLHYAFTVEDPDTWAAPWSGEYEFAPTKGDVYEYACHEGNYGLENILAGARAEEAAAATVQAAAPAR